MTLISLTAEIFSASDLRIISKTLIQFSKLKYFDLDTIVRHHGSPWSWLCCFGTALIDNSYIEECSRYPELQALQHIKYAMDPDIISCLVAMNKILLAFASYREYVNEPRVCTFLIIQTCAVHKVNQQVKRLWEKVVSSYGCCGKLKQAIIPNRAVNKRVSDKSTFFITTRICN